jgi:hypothetical protein
VVWWQGSWLRVGVASRPTTLEVYPSASVLRGVASRPTTLEVYPSASVLRPNYGDRWPYRDEIYDDDEIYGRWGTLEACVASTHT